MEHIVPIPRLQALICVRFNYNMKKISSVFFFLATIFINNNDLILQQGFTMSYLYWFWSQ